MQPRIEVMGFSSLSFFIQPSLQEDRFHPNRMQRMSPMTTTQAAMLACSSCSRSTAQSIFEYIFQQKLTFDHAMKHHQDAYSTLLILCILPTRKFGICWVNS
jgi:hypothetical protein